MQNEIFDEIKNLVTEARNPASNNIDRATTEEILRIINSEDQKIPAIVAGEREYITQAVDLLVESFQRGGRLFYIGAGSSGRLDRVRTGEVATALPGSGWQACHR